MFIIFFNALYVFYANHYRDLNKLSHYYTMGFLLFFILFMGRLAKNGKRCKLYKRAELRDNDHYATTSTIPPPSTTPETNQPTTLLQKNIQVDLLYSTIFEICTYLLCTSTLHYIRCSPHKRCVSTYTAAL